MLKAARGIPRGRKRNGNRPRVGDNCNVFDLRADNSPFLCAPLVVSNVLHHLHAADRSAGTDLCLRLPWGRTHRDLVKRSGAGRAMARQFLDAATSIGANEEEAQAAASKGDFIAKQAIVLREAREAHFWLRLFERCTLGDPEIVRAMRQEAGELVGIFTTIVKHARTNGPR